MKPFVNFSKFKKVREEKDKTIMKSPEGHEVHIIHKLLSPKVHKQLKAIPLAEGGEVSDDEIIAKKKEVDDYNKTHDDEPKEYPQEVQKRMQETDVTPRARLAEGGDEFRSKVRKIGAGARHALGDDEQPKPQQTPSPQAQAQAEPEDSINRQIGSPFADGGEVDDQSQAMPIAQSPEQLDNAPVPTIAQQPPQVTQIPLQTPEQSAAAKNVAQDMSKDAAMSSAQANPQDPYGTSTMLQYTQQGLAQEKAGIDKIARGETVQGKAQAQAAHQTLGALQGLNDQYTQEFNRLDTERKALQDDIANFHIDPNHYLGSMDTGQKIGTAIGLALGGLGSGITHGPNYAMDFINKQIDRDIEAQKADLGKKENLLSANMRQFGNLHDAMGMTRVMMMDMAAQKVAEAGAKAVGTISEGRAQQLKGQLDMQSAPILSQLAMRKTLLSGGPGSATAPGAPPELKIRALVPNGPEQDKYFKELGVAQQTSKAKDNLLNAFDKVSELQSPASRIGSPIQSKHQIDAMVEPLVASLSKETAGRYTEQDAAAIKHLFPDFTDSAETVAKKRAQLEKIASEKMNFPMLESIGIHASAKPGTTSAPAAQPQIKIVNGIKYMRGPDGKAVRVQ